MPVFDFVCTDTTCAAVTEKIVRLASVETISCPVCGAEAQKPELGHVQGAKLHRATYFNYVVMD